MIQYRLEALHDLRGLYSVAARTYAQVNIRLGDIQLIEKSMFHRFVVVLSGVHQTGGQAAARRAESSHQWGYLHEIRPRTYHAEDMWRGSVLLHHLASLYQVNCGGTSNSNSNSAWPVNLRRWRAIIIHIQWQQVKC